MEKRGKRSGGAGRRSAFRGFVFFGEKGVVRSLRGGWRDRAVRGASEVGAREGVSPGVLRRLPRVLGAESRVTGFSVRDKGTTPESGTEQKRQTAETVCLEYRKAGAFGGRARAEHGPTYDQILLELPSTLRILR